MQYFNNQLGAIIIIPDFNLFLDIIIAYRSGFHWVNSIPSSQKDLAEKNATITTRIESSIKIKREKYIKR